jgi:hypothetical protein
MTVDFASNNMQRDPTYAPYCMRCSGAKRMRRVSPLKARCPRCGAVHEIEGPVQPMCDEDAERVRDAVDGSKYSFATGGVQVIWKGGSAVNAYSVPDYHQIGHWNIEFPEGLSYDEQKEIVKANIADHIAEWNFPS